jgi:hypothetical protein
MRRCCSMVRRSVAVILGFSIAAAAAPAALADGGPVLVVPGKPGVPVIINNLDARWAVVEGDWGLSRPQHAAPNVFWGRPPGEAARRNGFFPSTGKTPVQGRHEIEPPEDRSLPPPAENFSRIWSTSPEQGPPADLPVPHLGPGSEAMPPVIIAPQIGPRRRHHP